MIALPLGTPGRCSVLLSVRSSGPLSPDVHTDWPPTLSDHHGSCKLSLWVLKDSAHFLSIILIQDVTGGKERRRRGHAADYLRRGLSRMMAKLSSL